MNRYYIYWSEDRRDNPKNPSIWNCVITSRAIDTDLELFNEYNVLISSLSQNKVRIGWLKNEMNENVDTFVSNQNFYNDYVDGNIPNTFDKFEYDIVSYNKLKDDIYELITYCANMSDSHYEHFQNEVLHILKVKFFNRNKAFLTFKDVINVQIDKPKNKKKK